MFLACSKEFQLYKVQSTEGSFCGSTLSYPSSFLLKFILFIIYTFYIMKITLSLLKFTLYIVNIELLVGNHVIIQ